MCRPQAQVQSQDPVELDPFDILVNAVTFKEDVPDETEPFSPEVQATLERGEKLIIETEYMLLSIAGPQAVLRESFKTERQPVLASTQEDSNANFSYSPPMQVERSAVTPLPSDQSTDMSTEEVYNDDSDLLKELGSTLHCKAEPYVDASRLILPTVLPEPPTKGGQYAFFPEKLYTMLITLELEGASSIATFLPHKRSFLILDKERFVKEVLPKHFPHMHRYESFLRQIQLWGFLRASGGADEGAYYHPLFLRDRPELFLFMKRVGKPHGDDRRMRKYKETLVKGCDPNFYVMPAVQAFPLDW